MRKAAFPDRHRDQVLLPVWGQLSDEGGLLAGCSRLERRSYRNKGNRQGLARPCPGRFQPLFFQSRLYRSWRRSRRLVTDPSRCSSFSFSKSTSANMSISVLGTDSLMITSWGKKKPLGENTEDWAHWMSTASTKQ